MTDRDLAGLLFDLDGTLLDTAPDMADALNRLRGKHGLEPLDFALARTQVSNGAAGLLRVGFPHLDDEGREALREPYLQLYAENLVAQTTLFPGMDRVLKKLDQIGCPWGVVTNKPAYLTEPLLAGLALRSRCACVISGDTLPVRKPDPGPLLHAAKELGIKAEQAAYVGDAPRDIEAGRRAGMATVAVTYGYLEDGADPKRWQADHVIELPTDLLHVLGVRGATAG